MKVKEMAIGSLIPYEGNPRKNDQAVDAVAASIREFGFKVPVIIDKNKVVVAGHTRIKAAKKLGMDKVPVIVADDLTDEQIKAFRLIDNKSAELAEWDFEAMKAELEEIGGIDMSEFGFLMDEIRKNSGKSSSGSSGESAGAAEGAREIRCPRCGALVGIEPGEEAEDGDQED